MCEVKCFTSNDYNIESDYDSNANDTDIDDYEESQCSADTFVDRLRGQHEFGRAVIAVKNDSIDEIIENLKNVTDVLLGVSANEKYKLVEFISETDLGLSHECSAAYYKLYNAINNREIWALKCKSNP